MKIHIFDSSLIDTAGHNYEYTKSIYDEWRRRGLSARVYCHRLAEEKIVNELNAQLIFSRAVFDSFLKIRRLRQLSDFIPMNFLVFRDLRRLGVREFGPEGIALFHSINQHQLFGIYLWYYMLPQSNRPFLTLLFRHSNAGTGPTRLFYSFVFRCFAGFDHSKVFFITDSDVLSREFSKISGRPVTVFPIPHIPSVSGNKKSDSEMTIFTYLGFPRTEKGYHLLPEAIRLVLAKKSNVGFILQSKMQKRAGKLVAAARAKLKKIGDKVILLDRILDSDAYYGLLRDSDVLLVLNDPKVYHGQTSGIFAEAIAFGKPTIVSRNTWMADQVTQYPSVIIFDRYDPGAVAEAILKYLNAKEQYDRQAAIDGDQWKKFHSANNYVDMLLGLISSAGET